MTKYLQISADLVDVYNGSVLETGATIKFSYTDSIGHTFVTIPTGSVTTISSEWEIKSVSFIAEPQTGRTFSSFSIEVVEKFDNYEVVSDTASFTEASFSYDNIWKFLETSNSEQSATLIRVKCRLDRSTRTLKYDANGGSGAPTSSEFTPGTRFRLSTTKPTKSGATFNGWNIAGTTEKYAAGAYVTLYDDTTLYAMWSSTDYQPIGFYDSLVYKV